MGTGKLYGFYSGIVVQNDDPERRGRVKVFIPSVTPTIYDGWNNKNSDKSFSKIGKDDNDSLSQIIDKVKDILPWAECASPIIGETGGSYYNAQSNINEDGDGPHRVGGKPAKGLEDSPPQDSFGETYKPTAFNNSAKGAFSIPKVNSNVWVFFDGGDINYPNYFAVKYSEEDWKSINREENYPNDYENSSKRDGVGGDDTYRNQFIINQRGGVIEIINTDNNESVKISHYDGSFKVWEKGKTKELVKGSEHKLVTEDSNKTIEGGLNENISGSYTSNVGDLYSITTSDMSVVASKGINVLSPTTDITSIVGVTGLINCTGLITSAVDVIGGGVSLVTLSEFQKYAEIDLDDEGN